MATTDNELNDLIINDISQEEYDNLVATGQVQEGQIYATDGTGSGGGGASLPDQTGNAGKLLTTDGTTASWSQYSFVRTVQDGYYEQVNISQKKDAIGNSISFGVAIAATSVGSFGVSIGGRSSVNATSIGFSAEASGVHSVSIGALSIASGAYSIQLGYGTNKDANTFKVANQNGNFEMMSADGTIPAERMSSTAGTTGQVLTKTDDGMAWQDAAKGGASLPILMAIWSDHILNDVSWLRADTFSWQSGDVYKAAYEHLANEYQATPPEYYAWHWHEFSITVYTKSRTPKVGDIVYYTEDYMNFSERSTVVKVEGEYIYIEFNDSSAYRLPGDDVGGTRLQTDTIGDITIAYYLAEDGHKICLPDQESNIAALYEATGAADYYLLDTTNKQFKLPREDKDGKYLYFYVGNFTQEAIEQTAGLNAELFNSKADSDLKNTPLASLDNDDGKLKWDGINMSAMGMPSNKADSLIIGSSGATYTAPADGYFITRGTANIAGAYIVISNENIQLANNPIAFSEGGGLPAFLPVKKGDVIYIWYANVTFNHFRFIYAEGAK